MILLSDNDSGIYLRAVEPEDAEKMWEFECDTSHWVTSDITAPYSLHNMKEYALTYDADPFRAGQIRLVACKDSIVIGLTDLYEISAKNLTAYIGIYIDRQFRGTGYAQTALNLLEQYSIKLLNIEHLGVRVAADNLRSISFFEKCGYQQVGKMANWLKRYNRRVDLYILEKEF